MEQRRERGQFDFSRGRGAAFGEESVNPRQARTKRDQLSLAAAHGNHAFESRRGE
jgi:hypothetical protein